MRADAEEVSHSTGRSYAPRRGRDRAVDVVVGVYYRFTTTSKMWLDEAQTVNIASFPLRAIADELRLDGAPPLYYYLLHVWMGVFGHSDTASAPCRGSSGHGAAAHLWWVVRRGFGRLEAIAALAVLASSPFAVYFATEARMYSLVVLLVGRGHRGGPGAAVAPPGPARSCSRS